MVFKIRFLNIVLTIIIYFVGDTLQSILQNRKQTILLNIQEAENREQEAKRNLLFAKEAFRKAQQKVVTIQQNRVQTIQQDDYNIKQNTQQQIDKLYQVKQEIILLQRQKLVKEILKHIIDATFENVYQKLEKNYTLEFQKEVLDAYITFFCNYQI
uniref:ATP synthase subunit b n=1 Tax=Codium simulans TaxID=589376 RepID=A0A1I9LKI0_9CHLO|nr:ATP synthase subunit b [Codium simulans]ANJ70841.1 ATP synthase subunit b [Codium simulans]